MRVRTGWIALVALIAGLVACASEEAAETSATEAPAQAATSDPGLDFAPELAVDLDQMRRSPTGLYTQDLNEGTGLAAREAHVVTVHYTGWLPTGDKFDSSRDRGEPYSFQLGRRQVIAGWEEGVQGMRIGGVRRLVIPPSLAYGARGRPGAIPPNAYLVFEVELLDIKM